LARPAGCQVKVALASRFLIRFFFGVSREREESPDQPTEAVMNATSADADFAQRKAQIQQVR
jgi:hypothetical protein